MTQAQYRCLGYFKQVVKMEQKDASAFNLTPIGTVIRKQGMRLKLSNKWQISLHKCPHCGSTKTFHKERMKTMEPQFQKDGRLYANTSSSYSGVGDNSLILMKKDLCLRCGRDWVFEIFCWERLGKKGMYHNFKTHKPFRR